MRYNVSVKFHNEFIKVEGDHITIGLTSKPVKGKANAELVKKLAKHFGVPAANVQIVAGYRSKHKLVEIAAP